MDIKETQKKVDKRIKDLGGYWQPLSMLARLVEEVGELSRAINIKHGEKRSKNENDGREINKELADVVFTIFAIANNLGIDIEEALKHKMIEDYEIDKKTYADNNLD